MVPKMKVSTANNGRTITSIPGVQNNWTLTGGRGNEIARAYGQAQGDGYLYAFLYYRVSAIGIRSDFYSGYMTRYLD